MKSFKQFITEDILLENWSHAHNFDDMEEGEKAKYVYHVTDAKTSHKIIKHGLRIRPPRGRTPYPSMKKHTVGNAFVSNHHGVHYWRTQTSMAMNRGDDDEGQNPENIHVLKFPIDNIPKSTKRRLNIDQWGTHDARMGSHRRVRDPSSHDSSTAFKSRKKI